MQQCSCGPHGAAEGRRAPLRASPDLPACHTSQCIKQQGERPPPTTSRTGRASSGHPSPPAGTGGTWFPAARACCRGNLQSKVPKGGRVRAGGARGPAPPARRFRKVQRGGFLLMSSARSCLRARVMSSRADSSGRVVQAGARRCSASGGNDRPRRRPLGASQPAPVLCCKSQRCCPPTRVAGRVVGLQLGPRAPGRVPGVPAAPQPLHAVCSRSGGERGCPKRAS